MKSEEGDPPSPLPPPPWAPWRRGRRGLAALIGLLALASMVPLGALRTELVPEALFPSTEAERRELSALRADFGINEEALVILLEVEGAAGREGEDPVLQMPYLRYLHRLSLHLEGQPWVERVDSLTRLRLPHEHLEPAEEGPTLADLEAEGSTSREPSPELIASLARLLPPGSRLEMGAPVVGPLVAGAEPEAEEIHHLRETLRALPSLRRRLISDDGRVALIAASLRQGSGFSREQASERARELRAWLRDHPPPEGGRVHLSGLPELRASLIDALYADRIKLILLACLGSVIALAWAFRSPSAVLIAMSAAGMSAGIAVGAMALFGEPLNLLNNVVPPLLITISLGDAVHLLSRYREQRRGGEEPEAAAWSSLRAVGLACLLTSATTAIGFASLLVSRTEALRRFGALASLGVLLSFLVVMIFVPGVAPELLGRERGRPKQREEGGSLDRAIEELARIACRAPWISLALFALLGAFGLALAPRLTVETRLRDQLEPGSPSAEAAALLDEELSGLRRLSILLRAEEPGYFTSVRGIAEVRRIREGLRGEPGVRAVDDHVARLEEIGSLLLGGGEAGGEAERPVRRDLLGEAEGAAALLELAELSDPSPLDPYLRDRGRRARLEIGVRDLGDAELAAFDGRLRRLLAGRPFQAQVLGEAHGASLRMGQLSRDLLLSLGLAVGLIFLILGILLQSPRLALIALPPNLFPLAVVLGAMALFRIPLNASSAIVFTVSFGLAVDGTIHLLGRYREERARGGSAEAVIARTARGSGRAVLVATLTLSLGFCALLFASFVPIRRFAELSLIAILSSLWAELSLLPALLRLFGGGSSTELPARSDR